MTSHWKSQLLPIPILFLLSLLAAAAVQAAAAEQQPITRPGCADKCGDLIIPFPFGMNNGCFRLGFEVQMVTSLYTTTGYMVSCVSNLQYNLQYANNGSCRGQGCCEATLQDDFALTMFGVLFGRKDNVRSNTNPCSYGMVVENSWYNFSTPDMYGDKVLSNRFPRGVPFVLDFAIRNGGSCPAEGQQPPQDYACVSGNSSCANAAIGEGYICKCWDHYGGNPYITNGCQDIDECELRKQSAELSRLYPCTSDGICQNVLGGYDCPCKPGMKGDGKAGTCTDKFPLAAKVTMGQQLANTAY